MELKSGKYSFGMNSCGALHLCRPVPSWHRYVPPVNLYINGRSCEHVAGVPLWMMIFVMGCAQSV